MESGTHSNEAVEPLVRVTFIMDGPTEGTKREKKTNKTMYHIFFYDGLKLLIPPSCVNAVSLANATWMPHANAVRFT